MTGHGTKPSKYNINANIIRVIENLFDKAQSAVLFNSSTGDCLLYPLLERIIWEASDDNDGSVSISGPIITNFSCADGIIVNAEEEVKADALVDCPETTTTRYRMEVGADKTKVMTNKPKLLPKRDQEKRSDVRSSGELQVPVINHL